MYMYAQHNIHVCTCMCGFNLQVFVYTCNFISNLIYVHVCTCICTYINVYTRSSECCIITDMVLSEYAKIRILTLWRNGSGPTSIVEMLDEEGIKTTRKSVTCFIAR